jgi:hypothetical protein
MNWPETDKVQDLLARGGLTGAELEVLDEFVSEPLGWWQEQYCIEQREVDEEDEAANDPEAESYAESFPTGALLRRVNAILQNHAGEVC